MEKTKLTTDSFKDTGVETDSIGNTSVTEGKLKGDAVTTAKINDGVVSASDLSSTLDLSSKTISLAESSFNTPHYNIALLGFKMAVTENLTVFNLVDGVVDEFHDESGADEGEGSNDTYCASSDFYTNLVPAPISAGFGTTSITEPQTSTVGTNPYGNGYWRSGPIPSNQAPCGTKRRGSAATFGQFTVPTGMTSANIQVWGAAGGSTNRPCNSGGGGGYAEGALAVTASQVLYVSAGEGGYSGYATPSPGPDGIGSNGGGYISFFGGGEGGGGTGSGGGGLAGVLSVGDDALDSAPEAYIVAGAGGGAGYGGGGQSPLPAIGGTAGAGGGLIGESGSGGGTQNSENGYAGGGGSQTAGGVGGDLNNPNINNAPQADSRGWNAPSNTGAPYQNRPGGLFYGGEGHSYSGGGGSGYYGGGGGGFGLSSGDIIDAGGGGGSSFHGHPQITSGSTEDSNGLESGGATQPGYVADTGEAIAAPSSPLAPGEDGYVLITGTATTTATSSTTIVSNAFTAGSAPATSRLVVFQETVGSHSLNTDLVASVSRDGGSTFTTVTLADEGYISGSSGQRILAGVATISGQPSGTSMRWKLALANNQSKIHGVSLSWA